MKISKLNAHIPLLLAFGMGWYLKPAAPDNSEPFSTYAQQAIEATVMVETQLKTCSGDSTLLQKGAGVILSSNGLIVTNYHNIGEAEHIEVSLHDGSRYLATVTAREPKTDLALLQISARGLRCVTLGDSESLRPGEPVFAIGSPGQLDYSLTSGVISALNRSIGVIKAPMAMEQFIQTDAVMNPGSSGGPLLNHKGELIGINTAIISQTGRFEGYSFAQPVSLVEEIIPKLGNNASR
ncbi:MAG: trypsin-like peptidase domain-containing protein [Saprospiraceae bacterium]|nr:trypsin-like peptidase domain-containing protein [Saprospiraceae bacterium]